MPEIERDKSIIEHIKNYCNEIEETVNYFGDDFSIFQNDKIYRNAVGMCLLQIGELETHLSEQFKEENKTIPWRQIKDMRNVVVHGYGTLKLDLTWDTIKNDIPLLKKFCEEKLK